MKRIPMTLTTAICAIFIGLMMLTLPTVHASERPIRLYTEVSNPGEWADGFIERIAKRAVIKSDMLNSEVCGVILMRSDGLFEMTLYTTRQLRNCVTPFNDKGLLSFHTHPREGGGRDFSNADYAFPGYLAVGSKLYYQAGRGYERQLR